MMYLLNGLPAFFGTINITGNIIISGQGLFANGTNAAPSISFQSDPDTGVYLDAANTLGIATAGVGTVLFSSSAGIGKIKAHGTRVLALEAGTGNTNITLTPSGTGRIVASNSLEVVNAAGPYVVIGEGTGAAEYGQIQWLAATNQLAIGTQAQFGTGAIAITTGGRTLFGTNTDTGALLQLGPNGATGAASAGIGFGGDISLYRSAGDTLEFSVVSGTPTFKFMNGAVFRGFVGTNGATLTLNSQTGSVQIVSNNTLALTLDASQNATFAGSVTAAAAANFTFSGRSYISSPADGIIRLLNNAGTDFTRLQFGGTTASFPALARSGTNLLVVDATGGSYTPILAATFWATGPAVTVSAGNVSYGGTTATTVGAAGGASLLPATPLGYIIVNVAGTAAKIPYYNA